MSSAKKLNNTLRFQTHHFKNLVACALDMYIPDSEQFRIGIQFMVKENVSQNTGFYEPNEVFDYLMHLDGIQLSHPIAPWEMIHLTESLA